MSLSVAAIEAAIAAHGTIYFNADMQPVVPVIGQWFCEFELEYTYTDGPIEYASGQALVEYLGDDRVAEEYDDSDRAPRGDLLMLQS